MRLHVFFLATLMVFCSTGLGQESKVNLALVAGLDLEISAVGRDQLQKIFLKKTRYWQDGRTMRPIHRNIGSLEREQFLSRVLHSTEIELAEYWMKQKQVNGMVQPIQVKTNDLVVNLVASMPGAIGYVNLNSDPLWQQALGEKGVKLISITD